MSELEDDLTIKNSQKFKGRKGRKRLSKGAKKKLVLQLLEEGYSVREIREKVVVGNDLVCEYREELKKKQQKQQEALELKTNQEIIQAEALIEFKENKKEILTAIENVSDIQEKLTDFDKIIEEIQQKTAKNILKEEELKSQIYNFIGTELPKLNEEDRVELVQKLVGMFMLGQASGFKNKNSK